MRVFVVVLFLCVVSLCCAQKGNEAVVNASALALHNGLTEKIGNFSIELLFHTSKLQQQDNRNMIMSPFTVWSVLAVIAEGASDNTLAQLHNALRLKFKNREATRRGYREIASWLRVNTNTVHLAKINAIFVDENKLPWKDFQENAKDFYETEMIPLNFTDADNTARVLNTAISNLTHGIISKIVDSSYFAEAQMFLTSALYFKGQWTMPFNVSSTTKLPFFSSNGQKIGDVNMMYNRHTYPFSNIRELQARVIEIPYGKENRLSMLILLPNPNVSLENMFYNFNKVTLDRVFTELRISEEEFGEDEVDCFIPRFKIESNLDLSNVLKESMGIEDMFDQNKSRLPLMARTPLYVSKVVHKAVIEVTEDGTTAAGVTVAEFSNRIGIVRFDANRPFAFLIIEKVTNSIVFGGTYEQPSLY